MKTLVIRLWETLDGWVARMTGTACPYDEIESGPFRCPQDVLEALRAEIDDWKEPENPCD